MFKITMNNKAGTSYMYSYVTRQEYKTLPHKAWKVILGLVLEKRGTAHHEVLRQEGREDCTVLTD